VLQFWFCIHGTSKQNRPNVWRTATLQAESFTDTNPAGHGQTTDFAMQHIPPITLTRRTADAP